MPAKWQQWMPFRIDAFKSSPAVRAMHPAARAGYLYLLAFQWQSEDCCLPKDALDLAEISEIGDELWAVHGERILRKFETVTVTVTVENSAVTVEKLRNRACFEEWKEAKRIFESRQKAADRTNNARSPHENDTVTARGPSRSADTRTGTETGTGTEKRGEAPPSSRELRSLPRTGANGEFMRSREMWLELGIAADAGDIQLLAQVLTLEEARDPEAYPNLLLAAQQALARGEVVNRFWFKDRKFAGSGGKDIYAEYLAKG